MNHYKENALSCKDELGHQMQHSQVTAAIQIWDSWEGNKGVTTLQNHTYSEKMKKEIFTGWLA